MIIEKIIPNAGTVRILIEVLHPSYSAVTLYETVC